MTIRQVGVGAGDVGAFDAGLYKIASVTLAAPAATIDFPNIPQTYRALVLRATIRSDRAAFNFDVPVLNVNADAADANYDHQHGSFAAAVAAAAQVSAAAGVRNLNLMPAATADAGEFAQVVAEIADYAAAIKHIVTVRNDSFLARAAGNYSIWSGAIRHAVAAPITQVTLLSLTGSNFIAGSVADLYGILPGA